MKLNKHKKGITTVEDWEKACPPKKDGLQWKDGRSAKKLAEYITTALPDVPTEIETALKTIVDPKSAFDWDAEYITALPGFGEGRNHDAIFYNKDIVITIEAKADEPLGNTIERELNGASVNKLHRVSELLRYIFKGGFKNYGELRYQLLTASAGTILEAIKRGADTAVLIVLVFKTNSDVKKENLERNQADIKKFLDAVSAIDENGFKVIPNNTDIKLYFKEIII